MSEHIRLKRGLDIPIAGEASMQITKTVSADVIAVKPTDFRALVPQLVVKEGDRVLAGQPLFVDKKRPQVKFCSPCSGTVEAVVRGDKRKLLQVRVKADQKSEYLQHQPVKLAPQTRAEAISILLERGLWPMIMQRPYGIIANPDDTPKAIFISGMNTAPLSPDIDFVLNGKLEYLQAGVNILSLLTKGGVHLSLDANKYAASDLHKISGVILHTFDGPHPAGNVGVQINHISPINKGEVVWTVDMLSLAAIGKCVKEGIYDMTRLVAITGPAAKNPSYVNAIQGVAMSALEEYFGKHVRVVSGDLLTGTTIGADGYLGFFDNQISVLKEGDYYETFGWCKPFRSKKFSFSHTYWSWLCNKKKYKLDTNTNGGPRAFVVSDVYGKVLPMDIYPVYLFKACLAGDIEKMENLGIYEILPEDVALCEFVCPSKVEIQQIVSDGIDLMLKEMA
ncbi:MAG: Na(+)-translocating NADH-quinone reductase subunit A [Bacteroidales bacterium]|nr:Na(+)-translocating NADH-quinone reductase subunit A [Bacteroidales bacterium]